jgi:hypothetical protein
MARHLTALSLALALLVACVPRVAHPTTGLPVCAPGLPESDLALAVRVWGIRLDCASPRAVRVVVGPVRDGWDGAWRSWSRTVVVRPGARSPGVVVAHELGHALGMGHSSGACALMAVSVPPRSACPRVWARGRWWRR